MAKKRKNKEQSEITTDRTIYGSYDNKRVRVIVEKDGEKIIARSSICEDLKIVIVINNQFTSVPNTTQIASGAG